MRKQLRGYGNFAASTGSVRGVTQNLNHDLASYYRSHSHQKVTITLLVDTAPFLHMRLQM